MTRGRSFGDLDPKRRREVAARGGLAKAARARAAQPPRDPLDWSLLELADRDGMVGESWLAGRALLKISEGLPLTEAELAVYRACTGRQDAPQRPPREILEASGRRSAKSRRAALKAVYAACCKGYTVARGERPVALLLAADKEQARILRDYAGGIIDGLPELKRLVLKRTKWSIELATGVTIQVGTSDYRLVRGRTCCLVVADELCFWRSETSTSPDTEVIGAVRPALATIPGSQLIAVSSVYARAGFMYEAFQRHYGVEDSDVLCWRAPTATMNPTITPEFIQREIAADPERARAEWLSEWRSDVSKLLSEEAIMACVVPGRRELPSVSAVRYYAFVDPSGGSADSMTLAIGHREQEHVVIDAVRERKPKFDPADVVKEFVTLLRAYHIREVRGDRFGGAWVQQAFRAADIEYLPAEAPKSDLYARVVPTINTAAVELLDLPVLVTQLAGLERKVVRGTGREVIDHAPHCHDDVCNSVAGVIGTVARIQGAGDIVAPIQITKAPNAFRAARVDGTPLEIPEHWRGGSDDWGGNDGFPRGGRFNF